MVIYLFIRHPLRGRMDLLKRMILILVLASLAGCGCASTKHGAPPTAVAQQPAGQILVAEDSLVAKLIAERRVLPGMTKEQVFLAKGKPEAVNVIEGGWGTIEQWVYGGYHPQFIYITNGRVSAR